MTESTENEYFFSPGRRFFDGFEKMPRDSPRLCQTPGNRCKMMENGVPGELGGQKDLASDGGDRRRYAAICGDPHGSRAPIYQRLLSGGLIGRVLGIDWIGRVIGID